jgi:hypothetical protein
LVLYLTEPRPGLEVITILGSTFTPTLLPALALPAIANTTTTSSASKRRMVHFMKHRELIGTPYPEILYSERRTTVPSFREQLEHFSLRFGRPTKVWRGKRKSK